MHAIQLAPTARQCCGDAADVLADVLRDGVNLAVWERTLRPEVTDFAQALLAQGHGLSDVLSVETEPGKVASGLTGLAREYTRLPGHAAFVDDVVWLVEAFACLLEARRVGVRLRLLDNAMCPRFHADRVPLRLVTTYAGPGSEWLPGGLPAASAKASQIRTLQAGHVALLKGERWEGNELTPIIHRSPALESGERRLLLTLDWLE